VGSGHSWSPTGYTDGVIIDIRKLNSVVELSESFITVEAGAKIQDVVQYLFARGLYLHGVGSIRAQAVGGVVSQGVHGPHPDGLNRHVIAMRVLLANGEFKRLSSSEDLFMWRSSLGLLSVIVHVTFQIFPMEWLRLERSPIKGFSDLRDLSRHLDPANTFTAFLYPTRCSRNIGWKRVGTTMEPSSQPNRLQVQTYAAL
jgi:FAD/FMN-containing dehydrogenase